MRSGQQGSFAITADRVVDGTGRVIRGGLLVVEGARIAFVGEKGRGSVPAEARHLDFPGCTVLPGLIDTHMHLAMFNITTFRNYRVATFEVTPELQTFYALLHAQMCLEMGYTTIRDMGMVSYAGLLTRNLAALRDAINVGIIPGPRILVAGWAVITGGHLELILPPNVPRPDGVTADGPWELRKMVRQQIKAGCDFIKTCASGGGGTDKEEPDIRNMTQDELNAVVDEAHAFKKQCAVHCFTPEAQKMAVRAGADTVEHCVWTDSEALEMLKSSGTPVVPTLSHRTDRAIEVRRRLGTPEFVLNKMKRIQSDCFETFKRLHRAGVKIAMGTDMGYDPEMGLNSLELELYVEFGMTPMEAIQTATLNAAQAIGLGAVVGSLEPGKLADVVVVEGDPLSEIRLLQEKDRIKLVMKEGVIYVDKTDGGARMVIHDACRSWRLIV